MGWKKPGAAVFQNPLLCLAVGTLVGLLLASAGSSGFQGERHTFLASAATTAGPPAAAAATACNRRRLLQPVPLLASAACSLLPVAAVLFGCCCCCILSGSYEQRPAAVPLSCRAGAAAVACSTASGGARAAGRGSRWRSSTESMQDNQVPHHRAASGSGGARYAGGCSGWLVLQTAALRLLRLLLLRLLLLRLLLLLWGCAVAG